jgi:hypothetical protein
MSQLVIITLTLAEADSGPFNLYCVSSTGIVTGPFQTNVPKSLLVAGYVVNNLPAGCQKVRVQSNSVLCKNYIDLSLPVTTTTSTTIAPTTTTTTTVRPITTTTVRPATTTTTTQILVPTTTTTTSSTTTTSTTSTSTTSTSTTSTTTIAPSCITYGITILNTAMTDTIVTYNDCDNNPQSVTYQPDTVSYICAKPGSVVLTPGANGNYFISNPTECTI